MGTAYEIQKSATPTRIAGQRLRVATLLKKVPVKKGETKKKKDSHGRCKDHLFPMRKMDPATQKKG